MVSNWGRRVGKMIVAILIIVALLAAIAFAVIAIGARRVGMSRMGWAISYLYVPIAYGRKGYDPVDYRQRIATNHRAGPGRPSAELESKYRISESQVGGIRVFRLAGRSGPSSSRILFLHGGGYVFDLDVAQWQFAADMAERTGAEIVIPVYRLAPEGHAAEGLQAVEASYLQAVDEVGVSHVAITGDSAGGGLTLALAQRLRDTGKPLPASLVLFYPWLDVTMSGTDQPALQKEDPFMLIDELRASGKMWAGGVSTRDPSVSPLFGNHRDLPPILSMAGARDILLSDTRRLVKASPGIESVEYPGMFHAFIVAPIPEREDAINRAATFMKKHWGAKR